MNQLPLNHSDSEESNSSSLHQSLSECTVHGGVQAAKGSQNIQIQGDGNVVVSLNQERLLISDLQLLSRWQRFRNTASVFFFLLGVSISWTISSFFISQYAFPFDSVKLLFSYYIKGKFIKQVDHPLWEALDRQQHKFINSDLESEVLELQNSKEKALRLNKIDSNYWLTIQVINLLSKGIKSSEEAVKINQLTEALQEFRTTFESELHSLKKEFYKTLTLLENALELLKENWPGKEYRRAEKILDNLIKNQAQVNLSTKHSAQALLVSLDAELKNNSNIKILYKVQRLIGLIENTRIIEKNSSNNTGLSDSLLRARSTRKIYHADKGCPQYPRAENLKEKDHIIYFECSEEASQRGYRLCYNCEERLSSSSGKELTQNNSEVEQQSFDFLN